jgi:hypothetical protein
MNTGIDRGYEVKIDGATLEADKIQGNSISLNLLPPKEPDPETPYTIEVRALGDGVYYADSEWAHTIFIPSRKLPAPEGLEIITADGVKFLKWDEVFTAAGYGVYQKNADSPNSDLVKLGEVTVKDPDLGWCYSLEGLQRGGYILHVKSLGTGYRMDSEFSEGARFDVIERLATPELQWKDGKTLTWAWDDNASSYTLYAQTPYQPSELTLQIPRDEYEYYKCFSLESDYFDKAGLYQITIQAKADIGSEPATYYRDSEPSETVTYIKQEVLRNPDGLRIEDIDGKGFLVWNKVEHASGYRVEIIYTGTEPNSGGGDWADPFYTGGVFPEGGERPSLSLSDLTVFAPGGAAQTGYYAVRVIALGDSGDGGKEIVYTDSVPGIDSEQLEYVYKEKLQAPTSLSARYDAGYFVVSWDEAINAAGYEIQVFEKGDGDYKNPYVGYAPPLSELFTEHTLPLGLPVGDYKIAVRAVGDSIYTDSDEAVLFYTVYMILQMPEQLQVTEIDGASIMLQWEWPHDYFPAGRLNDFGFIIEVTKYNNEPVEYPISFADAKKGNAFEYAISELDNGGSYSIRIRIVGDGTYYVTPGVDDGWCSPISFSFSNEN